MKESSVKDEIWILSDNRAGNYSQVLGLAKELGINYKIVNIDHGPFSLLPNLFLRSSLVGLNKTTKDFIKNLDYYPKVAIAAGRRCAPILLYLKKKSLNRTKIIQIMNPSLDFKKFDCLIIPLHDKIKYNGSNLLRSVGAITKVSDSTIKYEVSKFSSELNSDKKKIAVFIGGDTKKTKFDRDSLKLLITNCSNIAKNIDAQLLVLTSRRTSESLSKAAQNILSNSGCDYKFYDYINICKNNPYLAIMGVADYFIVSGDSVSMISEACGTGKPVYIFDNNNISSKKHRIFHHQLLSMNCAFTFDKKSNILFEQKTNKLNEAKRISLIIKNILNI